MTPHERLEKIRDEVILDNAVGMPAGVVFPELFIAIKTILDYADKLDIKFQWTLAHNLRTRISESLIGC